MEINIHKPDWKHSIMNQLQHRKSVEQTPFEDICSFACNMFDKVDIYKSENIQLNLQREQLQQQLLGIQQTLLAGGSVAAKTILSKLSTTGINEDGTETVGSSTAAKNLSLQHATLLAEKSQLEKKILDLQEKLADVLKSKSDTVQKVVDLKTELDEKDRVNRQLTLSLEERDKEVVMLKETFEKLDIKHRTLTDEYLALTLSYKSLEKRHHALKVECDALSAQILAVKREDADRLNAENDRIMMMQQERLRRELEANVNDMTQVQLARQAAGDPAALALAAMAENFDILDDEDNMGLNCPSRIPGGVEFTFDGHEGETCAVNWYCCSGPKDDYLATGGSDRKLKLWKIVDSTSKQVDVLLGSNASITAIDIEADAILAASNDYATRIWSVNNHQLKRTLTGHSAKVLSAKFLGVPNKVASGSQDRTVKIWDINQGSCVRTYFAGSSCYDLVYSNYQVITGHFDAKIRCWDLRQPNHNESTGQIVLQSKITSLDLSRDGTKLICSLRDNTIKCLDLRKMEVLQTYSDEKFKLGTDHCRAKLSADGFLIACGSNDGSMYIWDANTAKIEKVLTGHNTTVLACCWSPDGKRMVSIERGKKITIWV